MDLNLFFDVFDWVAVLYALASGVIFGSTLLLFIALRLPSRRETGNLATALIATGATLAAGWLFFAGQIVQAYASDPYWPRAVGRAALWGLFSVGIGFGLGFSRSFAHRDRSHTIDE